MIKKAIWILIMVLSCTNQLNQINFLSEKLYISKDDTVLIGASRLVKNP